MENIPIGTQVPGLVTDVFVKIDNKVKKGAPLFKLDDRAAKANLAVREAMLAVAEAQLAKAKSAPAAEGPPAEAMVDIADAKLHNAEVTFRRSEALYERSAGPQSDRDRDYYAWGEARASLAKARADLERLRNYAWNLDIKTAESSVQQAKAQVEEAKTELERLTVVAYSDGDILQVSVRPGQFAALAWKEPLIVLGNRDRLHVRVDIDEQDLPMFRPGARAIATLKGRPGVRFPLEFVKVEPYVIPKRSLTGDNAERVDTRVLQVIYALPDERPVPVYVGQQMDVYIESAKLPKGLDLEADPNARKPFEDEPAAPATPQQTTTSS